MFYVDLIFRGFPTRMVCLKHGVYSKDTSFWLGTLDLIILKSAFCYVLITFLYPSGNVLCSGVEHAVFVFLYTLYCKLLLHSCCAVWHQDSFLCCRATMDFHDRTTTVVLIWRLLYFCVSAASFCDSLPYFVSLLSCLFCRRIVQYRLECQCFCLFGFFLGPVVFLFVFFWGGGYFFFRSIFKQYVDLCLWFVYGSCLFQHDARLHVPDPGWLHQQNRWGFLGFITAKEKS